MIKGNTKKIKLSWFRSKKDNQVQINTDNPEKHIPPAESLEEEQSSGIKSSEQSEIEDDKNLFAKNGQDKVIVDLITSIENVIQDRQLMLYKNNGLDEQLNSANDTINRIKQDLVKKDQLLQEKNKEIRELENSLTNNQMAYDQLLEDYRDYQTTSSTDYEKLSSQLETEITKYKKLNEESIKVQNQNILKINELEEKVRNLEIENQQYIERYQNIVKEKSELIETINDFTQRMSFSFTPKTNTSNSSDSE